MSYDINILVNGSRCKQYNHNGKVFIEAKRGSEYTIEIKNNTWNRILAVCSVDGLDILNGEPAKEDNAGYVINGYNTGKFDGFRVSNEKVARFVFDYKDRSYAASKEDGSERNVGVIGVRLFEEKEKPVVKEIHHRHDHWNYPLVPPWRPYWERPTIWCETLGSSTVNCYNDEALYSCDSVPTKGDTTGQSFTKNAPTKGSTRGATRKLSSTLNDTRGIMGSSLAGSAMRCCNNVSPEPQITAQSFDMGTKWGEAKESKVIEVDFERGILALSLDVYYASRQSLIEMGVPIGNEKQVSFPESFKDSKYSKPPKHWRG